MTDLCCLYCGGAGRRANLRGGWECASCGAPAGTAPAPVLPQRLGRFRYDGQGGIVEINELLRRQQTVQELYLNAQDFADVAQLITEHAHAAPYFRQALPLPATPGQVCGWYFNKHASLRSRQLVRVSVDPQATWPMFSTGAP